MDLDNTIQIEGIQRKLRGSRCALERAEVDSLFQKILPELTSLGLEEFSLTVLPSRGKPISYTRKPDYAPSDTALDQLCRAASSVLEPGDVGLVRVTQGPALLSCFSANQADWVVLKADQQFAALLGEIQEDFWYPFFEP